VSGTVLHGGPSPDNLKGLVVVEQLPDSLKAEKLVSI